MILILFLVIVGSSYLYYRYYSVTDKKRFFRSPLFIGVSGSFGILLASIVLVNNVAPESFPEAGHSVLSDSLSTEEADTNYQSLRTKGPGFHFGLITKVSNNTAYASHFSLLEDIYHRFCREEDIATASLGNFSLGVISMQRGEHAQAREHFAKVSDDNFPFLHFCKAQMLMKEGNKSEAVSEYRLELQNESGNRVPSFLALLQYYTEEQSFEKLHELLQYPEADGLFPDHLARTTLLHVGDFLNYPVWLAKMLVRKTNTIGFIAGLLIAVMWLIYLFRLDIFKPEKFFSLLLLFIGGMCSVPLVFLFNDTADLISNWSLNDTFFNDLLYSIFMIGVPEEFCKALPLLLLVCLRKYLDEPIDYIIYGCASALGFAFIENLLYFQEIDGGIIHGRAYLSAIGHMADTSLIAYGFVMARYQLKTKGALRYTLPVSFFSACIVHGIYDLLLFHEMIFLFLIFFVLIVQIWLIAVNNCMNNSSHFTYAVAPRAERSRIFVTIALTAIFAFEYITVSFTYGSDDGNAEFLQNTAFAGSLIIFFSSNLGSFDLIKGYWRNIRLNHVEKRGYGSRQRVHPLIGWYFVNASQSHNYVGLSIAVTNDPYNKALAHILYRPYYGRITNRVTLYDEGETDPHWFLVKLSEGLDGLESPVEYVLVKLRYTEDSLRYEDEVQVHLRIVTDVNDLQELKPDKTAFPFYGWAYIAMSSEVKPTEVQALSRA